MSNRRETVVVVQHAADTNGDEEAKSKRFDRRVAIAGLIANSLLAAASIFIAKVGLDVTRQFNAWQVSAADKMEQKTKADDREDKRQYCIHTALTAVGIIAANRAEITDRVAGAISAIKAECLAVDINVETLVVTVSIRAKKTQGARTARVGGKPGQSAQAAAPDATTISRITDRFHLGEPQLRGFDIRGVGPRIDRIPDKTVDDAIVQSSDKLVTPAPRVETGIGVDWNSPMGPLRIDVVKALPDEKGDTTKLVTFNPGTQF